MIKLNPIETLPDEAKAELYIYFTNEKWKYTTVKYVDKGRIFTKNASNLIVSDSDSGTRYAHQHREDTFNLKSIHGWIYRDDLLDQLIPAHNVDVEGAKIKNVEVSE